MAILLASCGSIGTPSASDSPIASDLSNDGGASTAAPTPTETATGVDSSATPTPVEIPTIVSSTTPTAAPTPTSSADANAEPTATPPPIPTASPTTGPTSAPVTPTATPTTAPNPTATPRPNPTATATPTQTATPLPAVPVVSCSISPQRAVAIKEALVFTASAVPANVPISFAFDHGDGTIDPGAVSNAYYLAAGNYAVRLKWNTTAGASGVVDCGTVVVVDNSPVNCRIGLGPADGLGWWCGDVFCRQGAANPASVCPTSPP